MAPTSRNNSAFTPLDQIEADIRAGQINAFFVSIGDFTAVIPHSKVIWQHLPVSERTLFMLSGYTEPQAILFVASRRSSKAIDIILESGLQIQIEPAFITPETIVLA